VVYVDNDPVVCSHGRALLGPRGTVGVVLGDLRRPAGILRHPEVLARLDFSRPAAVLCACALHFVPDEEQPHQIIAGYRDHLAPGSYLAITHGITAATPQDDPDGVVQVGAGCRIGRGQHRYWSRAAADARPGRPARLCPDT